MKELWQQRLRRHFQAQFKYLKLVFNDHFVLVLIIMLGALLYGYAQLVRGMVASWWLAPALGLVFTALLAIGRLATIVEPADATFLLPQTSNFAAYLFKARRYSLWLPLAVLSFATLAAVPLLKVLHFSPLSGGLVLGAGLWAFKDCDLWLQLLQVYPAAHPRWLRRVVLLLVACVALIAGLYVQPVIVLVAGLVCDLGLRLRLSQWLQPASLAWQPLIAGEARRMGRIYRFYNLFTDVPGLSGTVRRRKYLDGFARTVRRRQGNTWAWLLIRSFLRRTEFIGLYVRLIVIGAVIVALTSTWWLAALLAALFVYLIGFQLLPLYQVHDEIVFTYLYPLPDGQKAKAFRNLIVRLLALAAVLLALGAAIGLHWLAALCALGAGLVMTIVIGGWYLPLRLQKLARR